MDERLITVVGEAETRVTPNQAQVTVGVELQEPTAREAQAAVDRVMSVVTQRLLGLGIRRDDIRTVSISLEPVLDFKPDKEGRPEVVAYRARNLAEVTVTPVGRLGQVIDAASQAGANRIENVRFTFTEEKAVVDQLIGQAIRAGRDRASLMAQAAGVRLGSLMSVSVPSVQLPGPLFAGVGFERAAPTTPVFPGELLIRVSVSLSYAIRD